MMSARRASTPAIAARSAAVDAAADVFVQQNAGMRQQIQAPLFEDKVVDHIFEQVTVKEKNATKDQLQKAVEALDDE